MPPPACVSCSKANENGKLISCLHSLCLACVEEHVEDDGSIRCPSCASVTTSHRAGVSSFHSLPASYPQPTGDRSVVAVVCDECFEDAPVAEAVSTCEQCKRNFCETHAGYHSQSRSTRYHKLSSVSSAWRPASDESSATTAVGSSTRKCALHPSRDLAHFCVPCDQLMCKRCMERGAHVTTDHAVLAIRDAAEQSRESVRTNVLACTALHGAVVDVHKSIQTLHEQTQNASQAASDFYAAICESVKEEEKKVLEELDGLRLARLLPLEKQLARLEESVARREAVSEILKSCNDDVDSLLLWKWLNSAIDATMAAAKNDAEPCVSSDIIFRTTDTSDLLACMNNTGAALDVGEVRRPSRPDEGNVDAGVVVAGERVAGSAVGVAIEPAAVSVIACSPHFDTDRSHADLEISEECASRHNNDNDCGHCPACTTPLAVHAGVSQVRVRIEQTHRGCMYIGLCSSANPQLEEFDHYRLEKSEIFAWHGSETRSYCKGGSLGQPWQNGDIIRMSLDHRKNTVTGLHERSGVSEVLHNATGDMRVYVALYDVNEDGYSAVGDSVIIL